MTDDEVTDDNVTPLPPWQLSPWELRPGDITADGLIIESVVPDPINEGLFAIKFAGNPEVGFYANERFVIRGRRTGEG